MVIDISFETSISGWFGNGMWDDILTFAQQKDVSYPKFVTNHPTKQHTHTHTRDPQSRSYGTKDDL